jgi:hypothetical protein
MHKTTDCKAHGTLFVSVTKSTRSLLFREIIVVGFEILNKHNVIAKCRVSKVKSSGIYI